MNIHYSESPSRTVTYSLDTNLSTQVEWSYSDRRFKIVDTAGLTRVRVAKKNLLPDRHIQRAADKVGYENIILPGTRGHHPADKVMLPDDDPSQFSYQISEMALQSALNALRFAQVVLLVVEGDQGQFSKIDLQLARKCLKVFILLFCIDFGAVCMFSPCRSFS